MRNSLYVMLTTLSMAIGTAGCPQNEGPMQKAGEKVDEAAETIKDGMKKDGPAEKAGEEIDQAAEDMKEAVENATE